MEKRIKVRMRFVIIKNGKFLAYYDPEKDFYFYPGGQLEWGESIEEGWNREAKEELGDDVVFAFKKILYIRDFVHPKENEHSLELYVLGDINKFEEVEGRPDPEFNGRKWPTWVALNKLPKNLYPKNLSKKLVEDYKKGFPNSGEYIGKMD